MTLALSQSISAVAPNIPASFLGLGGSEPYFYSVIAGGAGGTIDAITGAYVAPSTASSTPKHAIDTIQVEDAVGNTATAEILVGTTFLLVCDILAQGLGLARDRIYLWDQKINEPTDSGLFIAVSNPICKPYANINRVIDGVEYQTVNMFATLDLDIISRGPEARDRKEEVILALKSIYSKQQQESNSFQLASISSRFLNLTPIDGAAIPYRYKISVNVNYAVQKSAAIPYFDSFEQPLVFVDDSVPDEYGYGIRTLYETRTVGTEDWVVLIWKLLQDIKSITVFDTSGQTLEIGICNYNAPENSEIRQFLVGPGGINVDIEIPFGQRVSIRAVSGIADSGENDLSVFF